MSSKIFFVDIFNATKGSLVSTIFVLYPIKNFLKTKIWLLENSRFLKTTGEGAYAKHAILNYFIISDCIFVHDRHIESKSSIAFGIIFFCFNILDCGESSYPSSLNTYWAKDVPFYLEETIYWGKSYLAPIKDLYVSIICFLAYSCSKGLNTLGDLSIEESALNKES